MEGQTDIYEAQHEAGIDAAHMAVDFGISQGNVRTAIDAYIAIAGDPRELKRANDELRSRIKQTGPGAI